MRIQSFSTVFILLIFMFTATIVNGETSSATLEKSMSDTLDLWRDGRYEQLFDHLAHRGKTSREQFVIKMRDASIRPACCSQKLENFKILNEKNSAATVYAKIGLEGAPNEYESSTREFKLTFQENVWKMQLSDVMSLSGAKTKKAKNSPKAKKPKKMKSETKTKDSNKTKKSTKNKHTTKKKHNQNN